MNKFTACLNNSVRGKRERESAVSASGLKMEQKNYPECTEKTENKVRRDTQLAPCSKQGWGFEGVTH